MLSSTDELIKVKLSHFYVASVSAQHMYSGKKTLLMYTNMVTYMFVTVVLLRWAYFVSLNKKTKGKELKLLVEP